MGNVNMEAYQVHFEGKTVEEKLKELEIEAEKAEALPDLPTAEGKKVLTAVTDGQGNTDLVYEKPEVEGADIAPAFSEEVTYPAGTLVYYDGILYKFTADHAAGTWDPAEATPTSAAAEFVETNAAVDELKNTLIPNYTTSSNTLSQQGIGESQTTITQSGWYAYQLYGRQTITGLYVNNVLVVFAQLSGFNDTYANGVGGMLYLNSGDVAKITCGYSDLSGTLLRIS